MPNSELPCLTDIRNKIMIDELYSTPEFTISGVIYPTNKLFIHLDWPKRKLTPRLYRAGLTAISTIKKAAAARGIEYIYVFVPLSLVKWETMFGFEPAEEWTNRLGGENLMLMKQATA